MKIGKPMVNHQTKWAIYTMAMLNNQMVTYLYGEHN